jgi:hypothetical protein
MIISFKSKDDDTIKQFMSETVTRMNKPQGFSVFKDTNMHRKVYSDSVLYILSTNLNAFSFGMFGLIVILSAIGGYIIWPKQLFIWAIGITLLILGIEQIFRSEYFVRLMLKTGLNNAYNKLGESKKAEINFLSNEKSLRAVLFGEKPE